MLILNLVNLNPTGETLFWPKVINKASCQLLKKVISVDLFGDIFITLSNLTQELLVNISEYCSENAERSISKVRKECLFCNCDLSKWSVKGTSDFAKKLSCTYIQKCGHFKMKKLVSTNGNRLESCLFCDCRLSINVSVSAQLLSVYFVQKFTALSFCLKVFLKMFGDFPSKHSYLCPLKHHFLVSV